MDLYNFKINEMNINSALQYDYYGLIPKDDALRTKDIAEMIISLKRNEFGSVNLVDVDVDGLRQSAGIFLSELERDCPEYFI